jgi:hypothetical protein
MDGQVKKNGELEVKCFEETALKYFMVYYPGIQLYSTRKLTVTGWYHTRRPKHYDHY